MGGNRAAGTAEEVLAIRLALFNGRVVGQCPVAGRVLTLTDGFGRNQLATHHRPLMPVLQAKEGCGRVPWGVLQRKMLSEEFFPALL